MKLPDDSSFLIRPADMRDLDTLAAIDARCFPVGIAYPLEEIAFLLSTSTILTLVAERDGVIIGFAALQRRRRSGVQMRWGELVTIEVLPQFRRSSVGGLLYRMLEDHLQQWGGSAIQLHVAVENAAAVSFYRRLGYSVIRRVPAYYLGTIDAWQMGKRFNESGPPAVS